MLEALEIGRKLRNRRVILFIQRQLQQLPGIVEACGQVVETVDELLEGGSFLAQRLCAFRLIPDSWLLQFALYLRQPFRLVVIVKDTSSTP